MSRFLKTLSYLWALTAANLKGYGAEKKKLFIMSFFMMLQDSMFFILWVILFGAVKDLNGWHIQDVSCMLGIISTAIGLSLFLFHGARSIAYRVQDGSIEDYLVRPRSALPPLLLSSSSPASLGDILYGPLLFWAFGAVTWAQVPMLLFLILTATAIFTAMMVIIYSSAFWLKSNTRFPEQLFIMLIIFSSVIQHGQPLAIQFIMYTVMPAAFISYLPAQLIRHFDFSTLLIVVGATAFYVALALWIFNKGVRRYRASAA